MDANNSGSFVAGDISTTTDANGKYLLQLAPGTYTIRTIPATGASTTTPSEPASISATVKLGIDTSSQNFGLVPAVVPPTAANYTFTVANTATASPLNVLANDLGISGSSTGLTITAVTQGTQGSTIAIDSTKKGDVDYTPASGYTGSDSFTYTISDTNGLASTGTVTIDVTSATAAPTAANYSFTVANTATAESFNVLLNDKGFRLVDGIDGHGRDVSDRTAERLPSPVPALLTHRRAGLLAPTPLLTQLPIRTTRRRRGP